MAQFWVGGWFCRLDPGIPLVNAHDDQNGKSTMRHFPATMVIVFMIIFMVSNTFSPTYAADFIRVDTLCERGEQVLFSCLIDRKPAKILSLCGSTDLDARRGYLKYRFGTTAKVELEYPPSPKNSQRAFRYGFSLSEAQIRQASTMAVSFDRGDYRYEIFESIFPTDSAKQGVRVTTPDRTIADFSCAQPIVGSLEKLAGVVPSR